MGNLIAGSVESTPSGHGIIEELKKKKKKKGWGKILKNNRKPPKNFKQKITSDWGFGKITLVTP